MPQKTLKQLLIPTHLVAVCFRAFSQSCWLQDLRTYLWALFTSELLARICFSANTQLSNRPLSQFQSRAQDHYRALSRYKDGFGSQIQICLTLENSLLVNLGPNSAATVVLGLLDLLLGLYYLGQRLLDKLLGPHCTLPIVMQERSLGLDQVLGSFYALAAGQSTFRRHQSSFHWRLFQILMWAFWEHCFVSNQLVCPLMVLALKPLSEQLCIVIASRRAASLSYARTIPQMLPLWFNWDNYYNFYLTPH